MLQTKDGNPNGLYLKYIIRKVVGWKPTTFGFGEKPITKAVDKDAEYFVLRLDHSTKDKEHLKACRIGLHAYADAIENHLPQLAKDLKERYPLIMPLPEPPKI